MACSINGVTDIEDTITSGDSVTVRLKENGIGGVDSKRFRRLLTKNGNDGLCGCDGEKSAEGDSFIPGKYLMPSS